MEPDSSTTMPSTSGINLASFLDSDSDDSDHIPYEGCEKEDWLPINTDMFIDPP